MYDPLEDIRNQRTLVPYSIRYQLPAPTVQRKFIRSLPCQPALKQLGYRVNFVSKEKATCFLKTTGGSRAIQYKYILGWCDWNTNNICLGEPSVFLYLHELAHAYRFHIYKYPFNESLEEMTCDMIALHIGNQLGIKRTLREQAYLEHRLLGFGAYAEENKETMRVAKHLSRWDAESIVQMGV